MTIRIDDPDVAVDALTVADTWLTALAGLLRSGSPEALATVVRPDAWWRDLVAFTGDLRSLHGYSAMAPLLASAAAADVRGEHLDPQAPPTVLSPTTEAPIVQVLFRFDTRIGHVRGVARLVHDESGDWRAVSVLTALDSLAGRVPAVGAHRPDGAPLTGAAGRNWSERRADDLEFADGAPDVLIIGGGHAGLSLAAQLGVIGVRALVVDRFDRVGDNWRNRYDSLVLHDAVWSNHLPLMPFPPAWPVFTPKDKMGDWLEIYARALELNVWTRTEIRGAAFDPQSRSWSVVVDRDGERRELRPRHVVLATGLSGTEPIVPQFPGSDNFAGTILHSGEYHTDESRRGTNVVVIGTGNSGHDIAQDLHESGAHVTLVQRGPTHVVGGATVAALTRWKYGEDTGPTDVSDLLEAASARFDDGYLAGVRAAVQMMAESDRELLDGLAARGFALAGGEDGLGASGLFLTRNGGYYIDVGASALIVDGSIGLVSGTVDHFTAEGPVMADGTLVPADTVVLATGFRGILDTARRVLGDAVADRCTPVWGLDEEGELRSVWRRSGHDRFWINGGNFLLCRVYSKYLALQIAADLDGVDLT